MVRRGEYVWGGGGGEGSRARRERERILLFFKAATKGFNGRDFICPFVMFTAVEQRLICRTVKQCGLTVCCHRLYNWSLGLLLQLIL